VVAVAEGQSFDFDTMSEYLRGGGLRVNAVPEQLELVDEVPRNPAGKILKHTLRERFAEAGTDDGRQA
jgi:non-ribosomal peptide synthetase component E (peptide arylation enzyme)